MLIFHANPIEWAFFAISVILVSFTIYALRDAIIDSAFLVAHGVNGPRTLIADQNIREESIKVGIGMTMLFTSTASLFLVPPPPDYAVLPQALVSIIAWCLVSFLMILSSSLSRSVRKKLQNYSPIAVRQTVATLPSQEVGRTDQQIGDEAQTARDGVHVRAGERSTDPPLTNHLKERLP